MSRASRTFAFACALLSTGLVSGCAAPLLFTSSLARGRAAAHEPPIEVVCLWQPARGSGLNGLPARGLAGRVMFFTRGSATPVPVEGDIRIYMFDDQGTEEEQTRPIHQFDFRAEDWQTFLQEGSLGPTYNIFVPYVRDSYREARCTLQLRFTPKSGPVLYSDLQSTTLPGIVSAGQSAPLQSGNKSNPALAVHTIRQQDMLAGRVQAQMSQMAQQTPSKHVETPAAATKELGAAADRLNRVEQLLREIDSTGDLSPVAEQAAASDVQSPPGAGKRQRFRLTAAVQDPAVQDPAAPVAAGEDISDVADEHPIAPSHADEAPGTPSHSGRPHPLIVDSDTLPPKGTRPQPLEWSPVEKVSAEHPLTTNEGE